MLKKINKILEFANSFVDFDHRALNPSYDWQVVELDGIPNVESLLNSHIVFDPQENQWRQIGIAERLFLEGLNKVRRMCVEN